jgi:hypothetical protein
MNNNESQTLAKGDKVATDTGVNGTVAYTYTNAKGETMVKVNSSSYARGSHSIKATRLYKV